MKALRAHGVHTYGATRRRQRRQRASRSLHGLGVAGLDAPKERPLLLGGQRHRSGRCPCAYRHRLLQRVEVGDARLAVGAERRQRRRPHRAARNQTPRRAVSQARLRRHEVIQDAHRELPLQRIALRGLEPQRAGGFAATGGASTAQC